MHPIARAAARVLVPRSVRNWLRAPRATWHYLRDELLHLAGGDRTVALRPALTVRCHPRALREAYAAHCADPAQVEELDAFLDACRPGMCLLDAGAHYGLFALAAALRGGPGARAVAIDPSPVAIAMVRLEARLNGVADRITTVQAAVGASDGVIELVAAGVGSAGYYVPPGPGHSRAERTRVAVRSLDALAAELGCTPTHVKVDVEGFEADALAGAERMLTGGSPPVVFLEVHTAIVTGQGRDPAAALRVLERCGYALAWPDGRPATPDAILAADLARIVARPNRGAAAR